MFTGIVEEVGTLRSLSVGPQSAVVEVSAQIVLEGTQVGDSTLINGVCLTVIAVDGHGFRADVQPETARRTTLVGLRPGAALNLERALGMQSRLGGHMVSGHIDGIGRVLEVAAEDNAIVVTVQAPQSVAQLSVDQGSVALDGVSLTIVNVSGERLRVALIPHTASVTTLGRLRQGDEVNLEADLIAKYVSAFLERRKPSPGLTWEKLAEAGFV
jgi:riboflavin synthase